MLKCLASKGIFFKTESIAKVFRLTVFSAGKSLAEFGQAAYGMKKNVLNCHI